MKFLKLFNLVFLIIGSGGREHALAWKISKSPLVKKIFCAPGNLGTTMLKKCKNVAIGADEIAQLLEFALANRVNFVVIGPENPLAAGFADIFEKHGIMVFGPSILGALMEASKRRAKEIMQKYGIKTAAFKTFTNPEKAKTYVRVRGLSVVIKADGLTGGKGVDVFSTVEQGLETIDNMMVKRIYGKAGKTILIENRLKGQETSYQFFTDGKVGEKHIIPILSCEDHKPLLNGDKGPNTGGMGIRLPSSTITKKDEKKMRKIARRLVYAFKKESIDYRGLCYIGFMKCNDGELYVLEINCRFGDPETQPSVVSMKSDIVPILIACANGTLDQHEIIWDRRPAICVVLASEGYPENPEMGKVIYGLEFASRLRNVHIFHAGTTKRGDIRNSIETSGGRVLSIVGQGKDVNSAINLTYKAVDRISFEGMTYRKDIGNRAINK